MEFLVKYWITFANSCMFVYTYVTDSMPRLPLLEELSVAVRLNDRT